MEKLIERPSIVIATGTIEGMPYAITKHPMLGHLCGYLEIEGHAKGWVDELEVHGGITYIGRGYPKGVGLGPDDVTVIGFDCAHAGDLVPGLYVDSIGGTIMTPVDDPTYKDEEYVMGELEKLAAQVVKINQGWAPGTENNEC